MRYIVMDMEWNNAYCKQLGGFFNEVIEIGAVWLDEDLTERGEFSVIIHPVVGKRLQSRVKNLTHLTNEDVSRGVPFREAVKRFAAWLGEEENTFLTWGDGDVRTLIKNCEFFLNAPQLSFMDNYADLQSYCQGFTDAAGSGQQAKLANQIAVAGVMFSVCESLLYAQEAGLDVDKWLELVVPGAGGSTAMNTLGRRILKGDFAPGFFVEHFVKDLGLCLEECRRMGLVLPGTERAEECYRMVQALGGGKDGTQSLVRTLAQACGKQWKR